VATLGSDSPTGVLSDPLPPFTAEQTAGYVQHHLQSVGIDHPVFTDSALQVGPDGRQGVARRLSTWARTRLPAAYAVQSPLVDDTVVATAINARQWAGTVTS
jgi:type II secretory pathway predicted ATPase ExeA